jgi:hypothetical protein
MEMTNPTLATRAAAGLCAALISAMSLVACGGDDDSSAGDEPVERSTCDPDETDCDESADEPEPEPRGSKPARDRDERPDEPSESPELTAESAALSADEFCTVFARQEASGFYQQAEKPSGARRVSQRLTDLAGEAPRAIRDDLELLAQLYGEIADAKGDPDKIAAIDSSGLREADRHLKRWERKHC